MSSRPAREAYADRLSHLLLLLPSLLTLVSWLTFPSLAQWLSTNLFGYRPVFQPPKLLWSALTFFFYSWFTFLAIGMGGLLLVLAWFSRHRTRREKMDFYPMVSFVVPAFNEETQLPRCINSLFKCGDEYPGPVEVIVVDDGSDDNSYEIAFASLKLNSKTHPSSRGRIVRHMTNLGKVDALMTGANRAMGQLIAVVDADSRWRKDALKNLVEYMRTNGKAAATGYIHPTDDDEENNPYVVLQQVEYSQGLAVFRCAQALGNAVLVVPGAMGLFDAEILRDILNREALKSVTEDSEITLELQKKGYKVGYLNDARGVTLAPSDLASFWNQRLRWFAGWLHNTFGIHRHILGETRWLSILLWYCIVFEYFGAFVELGAIISFPFLLWFAPDRILFVLNLLWFVSYALLIAVILQAAALQLAYGDYNHKNLLYYTPFYSILWFINLWARLFSLAGYAVGYRGAWHSQNREL